MTLSLLGQRERCLRRETGKPFAEKEFLLLAHLSVLGPQFPERTHPLAMRAVSERRATGSGIHWKDCQDSGWRCQTNRHTR